MCMNGTGSRWDHDKVEAKAFGKQVFQALPSTCHLLQRCFIHTPENKVLMHQCAISEKDIKQNVTLVAQAQLIIMELKIQNWQTCN